MSAAPNALISQVWGTALQRESLHRASRGRKKQPRDKVLSVRHHELFRTDAVVQIFHLGGDVIPVKRAAACRRPAAPIDNTAATMSGKRDDQSCPLRVSSRTPAALRRAISR
jgi:hypothetical protein